MFVHLCLNTAEAFTSQCTKSECNSTVQQANETEINGKEKLWHSQYNMHRFSLSLDVRFERCYLSEITWLSFLWIQFFHIRAPHTHTHTFMWAWKQGGHSTAHRHWVQTSWVCIYILQMERAEEGRRRTTPAALGIAWPRKAEKPWQPLSVPCYSHRKALQIPE